MRYIRPAYYGELLRTPFLRGSVNRGQPPVEKYQLGRDAALVKYGSKNGELLAIDYAHSNSLVRLGVLADALVSGYYELSKFSAPGLCGGAHERPTKLFARLTGRGRGSRTRRLGHRTRCKDCHHRGHDQRRRQQHHQAPHMSASFIWGGTLVSPASLANATTVAMS
jgi:hypothetical protein